MPSRTLEQGRRHQRDHYLKMIEEGRCTKCGKPSERYVFCLDCRVKTANYKKKKRQLTRVGESRNARLVD